MKKLLFFILVASMVTLGATSTSMAQEQTPEPSSPVIGKQAVWLDEPYMVTNNSDTQAGYLQVFAVDESTQALFGRFWNLSADFHTFEYSGFGWVSQNDTQQVEPPSVSTPVTIGGSIESQENMSLVQGVLPEIPEQADCNINKPTPFLVEIQIQTSLVVDTFLNCNMFLRNYDGTRFWVVRDFDMLFETIHGFFMLETEENVFGWNYPAEARIGDGTCEDLADAICAHISDALGTIMKVLNAQPINVLSGTQNLLITPMSIDTPQACAIEQRIISDPFVGEIGCQSVMLWQEGESFFLMFYWGVMPSPEGYMTSWVFPATATEQGMAQTVIDDLIRNTTDLVIDTYIEVSGSTYMGATYTPRRK